MFGKCKGCHELAEELTELRAYLDDVRRSVQQLEGMDISILEKRVDEMGFEWDKWYGKFRSLYANMSRKAKQKDDDGDEYSPADEPINPAAAALLQRGP